MNNNLKFRTYDPHKSFRKSKNNTFLSESGRVVLEDETAVLFNLGKTAYDLLGFEESEDFSELLKAYFEFLTYLVDSVNQISQSKPILKDESGRHLKSIKVKPNDYLYLQLLATDLFGLFLRFVEKVDAEPHLKKTMEIDIESDIRLASLIQVLLEIDQAIINHSLKENALIRNVDTARKCLSMAESIDKKNDLNKQIRHCKAVFAANKRHAPINQKKEELRKIWATGKYSSRDICAEQECARLDISFSTARKALRNTPDPT